MSEITFVIPACFWRESRPAPPWNYCVWLDSRQKHAGMTVRKSATFLCGAVLGILCVLCVLCSEKTLFILLRVSRRDMNDWGEKWNILSLTSLDHGISEIKESQVLVSL